MLYPKAKTILTVKKIFVLFLISLVAFCGAIALLWVEVKKVADNPQELSEILTENLDSLLTEYSEGRVTNLGLFLEKQLGICQFVDRPGVAFPYAKAFDHSMAPSNENFFVSRFLCRRGNDESIQSFRMVKPVGSQAIAKIVRKPGSPITLEPWSGQVYISSKKLNVKIRLSHMYLILSSNADAEVLATVRADGFDLASIRGQVSLRPEQRSLTDNAKLIRLFTSPEGSFSFPDRAPLEKGSSVSILPTGTFRE